MKKNLDVLDLTKIILSLMVVAIHSQLFPMILYPWLRLAVPLFFIISSFLLHSKINENIDKKKIIIKHYILRLLKYYIFWFIALLPITIYNRRLWFDEGILFGVINIILKPFLGSTFTASWYIAASIIGTFIVDALSSKLNVKLSLFVFIIAYIVCCSTSSYSFVFEQVNIMKISSPSIWDPHCSFMVSLIYIYLGKLFANGIIIKKSINIVLLIISLVLLYIEWMLIYNNSGTFNNDCYIFIAPASILLFSLIYNNEIHIKNAKKIRQFSNFIYPSHASLIMIFNYCFSIFTINNEIKNCLLYIFTIICCFVLFLIVKVFENKFKFLKYSY